MPIQSTNYRSALLEAATKIQQLVAAGAVLPEGDTLTFSLAQDGKTITVNATIAGNLAADEDGAPKFNPTPSTAFPIA